MKHCRLLYSSEGEPETPGSLRVLVRQADFDRVLRSIGRVKPLPDRRPKPAIPFLTLRAPGWWPTR